MRFVTTFKKFVQASHTYLSIKEQCRMLINSSQGNGDLFVYLLNLVKCERSKKRGTLRFPGDKGPAEEQKCQLLPAFVIRDVLLSFCT